MDIVTLVIGREGCFLQHLHYGRVFIFKTEKPSAIREAMSVLSTKT